MTRPSVLTAISAAAVAWVAASAASFAPPGLSPQEKHGKQIYLRGIGGAGKEITAYLGAAATEVSGAIMTCANCHGYDGRGNPEGGVVPSDITWERLSKPYGVRHANGRRHGPYTDAALERAIVSLLDPAGQRLNPVMPRYVMSREDMTDLIAYMKRLGNDVDPGLTENTITVGTLLPLKGRLARMGEAVRAVLAAYFDELNAQGGIYSRKIELSVLECGDSPAETKERLARFLEERHPFAMVGAFLAGADQEVVSLLEAGGVPLVGAATLYPRIGFPLNRHIFYLFSGVNEEGRALVDFAKQSLKPDRIAIVHADDVTAAQTADIVAQQCRKSGWDRVAKLQYSRARPDFIPLIERLRQQGDNVLCFLGTGTEGVSLAQEAAKAGWRPTVLLPGALAGREIFEIPASFQGRIYLSFPVLFSDRTLPGEMEYGALSRRHNLGGGPLSSVISGYTAARVLVEGLKLSGRDLSREKLIVALEGLYKYETGVTPPITYGPNRRIGAMGAQVMELQLGRKELVPAGGWIEVE